MIQSLSILNVFVCVQEDKSVMTCDPPLSQVLGANPERHETLPGLHYPAPDVMVTKTDWGRIMHR